MGIKVGIDLGTTFSAVAMVDPQTGKPAVLPINKHSDNQYIIPSVIQFDSKGNVIAIGDEAKEAFEAGDSGCISVFKREMGNPGAYCTINGRDYSAEDLSAILLKYLKEQTEEYAAKKIEEAVVTVPAYFTHKERQATMNAASAAGLRIKQIINEPTAAAMTYGLEHWRENSIIMVYDLGGGTFDVTLVQMKGDNRLESLKTTGDHILGGKDWDERLVSIISGKIREDTGINAEDDPDLRHSLRMNAEKYKKQLTNGNARITLNIPDYGRYSTQVSIDEFEKNTSDLIEKTGSLCKKILSDLELSWKDITDILLVGGSTRMPQVSKYLEKISGHKPIKHVNPDEAVALGAAIQVHAAKAKYSVLSSSRPSERKNYALASGKVGQSKKCYALSMSQQDIVAHSLGIIAVSQDGSRYVNRTIVPANQQIPVKCAEGFNYYTSGKKDNEVEIFVLQGDTDPKLCDMYEYIAKYVAYGISHDKKNNPTLIKVQYSYDINGMIHVQARQGDSDYDLPIRTEKVTPEDVEKFKGPVQIEKEEPEYEDLSIVIAVDVSGSMNCNSFGLWNGAPIRDAIKAIHGFIDKLSNYPGQVRMSLIAVSEQSEILCDLTDDVNVLRCTANNIQVGMTGIENYGHPFDDIYGLLAGEDGKRIGIVLADGQWSYQDKAVSAARLCHKKGIDIIGIGFGYADKQFLKEITSGDISSIFVASHSDLAKSFGKIAQEIGGSKKSHKASSASGSVQTWKAEGE